NKHVLKAKKHNNKSQMNVVFLKACSPKSRMARRLQLSQHYRKLVRPWMFRFPGCSTINQKEISSYNKSLTDNSVFDKRIWAILMHYYLGDASLILNRPSCMSLRKIPTFDTSPIPIRKTNLFTCWKAPFTFYMKMKSIIWKKVIPPILKERTLTCSSQSI